MATFINATTPAHALGQVNVVVYNPDGQSTTLINGFTYVAAPTITSINPTSGPVAGGTIVAITGTNFIGVLGVRFGTTNAASYTVNSATSITATSPAGSAGANVTPSLLVALSPSGSTLPMTVRGLDRNAVFPAPSVTKHPRYRSRPPSVRV
jgi:hypothetical protein